MTHCGVIRVLRMDYKAMRTIAALTDAAYWLAYRKQMKQASPIGGCCCCCCCSGVSLEVEAAVQVLLPNFSQSVFQTCIAQSLGRSLYDHASVIIPPCPEVEKKNKTSGLGLLP